MKFIYKPMMVYILKGRQKTKLDRSFPYAYTLPVSNFTMFNYFNVFRRGSKTYLSSNDAHETNGPKVPNTFNSYSIISI